MRNGSIGLASVTVLALTIAITSCANYAAAGIGGTGGATASAGTGGTASAAGSSSTGGTATLGGSSSAGASSVTTLSGTKPLGSLTAAEATQLCSDIYAYYGRTVPRATVCKANGLTGAVSSSSPTDAVLQQFCQTRESTCLQSSATSPTCSDLPTPCTATVADLSACIVDTATAYNQGAGALPGCATVTLANLPAIWDFVTATPPASCGALDGTCAGLDIPTPRE